MRWVAGAVLLFGSVAALARWLRPELEAIGRSFVDTYGLPGMALGALVADAVHFPVPPQFYMLIAIASGTSPPATLAAVGTGSLVGGTLGFLIARRLGRWRLVTRLLASSARAVGRMGSDYGYRLVLGLSLTPIAFSVLCYLAGVYQVPKRLYALIALLRVPKLLLYYYLIRLGWGVG